jgi:DNA repair protein RadD
MTLRPYQQRALGASIDWMRQSVDPFIIEAATGAGKSHIIAEVARIIHAKTGKRVLCLAPSAELVTQNRAKYLATGNPCSLFSASAGGKDLRHPVVFGSPLTVKNRISRFCKGGADGFGLVVIDEAHGITPTVQGIVAKMREANPNLRVMGLTATPYRLGSGYIFKMWPDGSLNSEASCRDPYFMKCVDSIGAHELIEQGYLTPPKLGEIHAQGYDTSGLALNARGQFDADAVDRAYHGKGRLTAAIVADVVAQARDRMGVMFFAATVQHAKEIMESLPPELSEIVTGETKRSKRDHILARFKAGASGEAGALKYLVNVSVLTTGFDAPHVDVIAILRKTESVGLLQQIIGRGLRLHPGKADCLVLDYTENVETHCPDGDLFSPVIKANKAGGDGEGTVKAECEWCGHENLFNKRPEVDENHIDANGYCTDLDGHRVEVPDVGPMPAHFGRRCNGMIRQGPRGEHVRCEYRWTSKECPTCHHGNDIAARYCSACRGEIVDPNEKLRGDFRAMKKDPTKRQTDMVLSMDVKPGISSRGNKTVRVDFTTPYRSFAVWFTPEATFSRAVAEWQTFQNATNDGQDMPDTITYQKDADSGFYRIYAYNKPQDVMPSQQVKHAAE